MSLENVEAFQRALAAGNRGDVDALLEELDPEVEWYAALPASLGGETTVYRGHEGVRELFRDFYGALAEIHMEVSEIRDLGDRLVATGRMRTRGKASGAETELPGGYVVDFKDGKATRVRSFADPSDALKAAGQDEEASSNEKVEVVRAAFAAFNARNMEAFSEMHDSDVVLQPVEDWPEPGPYVGREETMRFIEQLRDTWDADTLEVTSDFIDTTDRVVVRFIWHGKGYGPQTNMEFTDVVTVREGRIRAHEFFWDHAEALKAAGLRG